MNTFQQLDEYFKKLKQFRESTDESEKERLEFELHEALIVWRTNRKTPLQES